MLRSVLISIFITAIASMAAHAQETGSLAGCVSDTAGEPVSGANILVMGTSPQRGAVTRPDGTYFIAGIRVGAYPVLIKVIGYEKYRDSALIVAGDTTSLDMRLRKLPPTMHVQYIIAHRYHPVVIGCPGTVHRLTSYELEPGSDNADRAYRPASCGNWFPDDVTSR